MENEIVFETRDENRYAPSANTSLDVGVDVELAKDLQKIPEKMAFKIGEVADLANVKAYVLRYWETEFPTLRPEKSKHNQRVYTRRDVELVFLIKKLLYKDRFSIEGARCALKNLKKETKKVSTITSAVSHHEKLRDQVHELIREVKSLKNYFIEF
ncbi:MAG: MerR family transcriptional regulator [Bdellovibrionaceae bacterium]|nr:MerR family transcriptional regulator [Pseudobdellovibrionaceae bacterium]